MSSSSSPSLAQLDPTNRSVTEYGRLQPSDSARITEPGLQTRTHQTHKKVRLGWVAMILLVLVTLSVSLATLVIVVVKHKNSPSSSSSSSSSSNMLVTRMCGTTRYPEVCVKSLGEEYYFQKKQEDKREGTGGGEEEEEEEEDMMMRMVELSMKLTMQRIKEGLGQIEIAVKKKKMGIDEMMKKESLQWSAHHDCVELMEDSLHLLTRANTLLIPLLSSLYSSSTSSSSSPRLLHNNNTTNNHQNQTGATLDMMTWMTAVYTNQDTCAEGFKEAGGVMDDGMALMLEDLSQLVSNNLDLSTSVITSQSTKYDVVIGRQLLGSKPTKLLDHHKNVGYPEWVSRQKRELLKSPLDNITAHITVSQDGIGPNITVNTISKAIQLAPKNSTSPFIIHIKAGRYDEANLLIGGNKTNLWFIGDGKGKTVITGNTSVGYAKLTTYNTASFGVTGFNFVAKGITFENNAGPENNQAVALRVKSDQAIFYECEMKGYQDTLYAHSNRQFYRNCDIYGTVDFIFGNAIAVFQNCTLYARKPIDKQKNTITAQKRDASVSYSGFSIHACRIMAAPDLEPVKGNYSTYLGRPWRELSTVVYMMSYIGDHVDPQGWLPWNATLQLDAVYYGEFLNHGPGANTNQRVQAPGVHLNLTVDEASRFTVDQFELGSTWITPTRIPFEAGLGS